jgi:hypothetical protein
MRVLSGALSLLLLPVAALAVAAPAHAAPTPEVEPNDTVFQVTATANTEGLTGRLATSDDVDHFWIGLRPQRQVRITATASGCSNSGADPVVEVGTMSDWDSLVELFPSNNSSSYAAVTTPGIYGEATRYFLVSAYTRPYWDSAAGCTYTLKVTSATGGTTDAIDPTPPATFPVSSLPEPDDLSSQATGPLAGDIEYEGRITTSNDVDNVFFQHRAQAGVNMTVTASGGTVYVDWGTDDMNVYSGTNATHSFPVSSSDVTRYVKITGSVGAAYRIRLSPASSLGTTVAPPPVAAPAPSKKVTKVTLRAKNNVVRRGGIVRLRATANVKRRVKITIWQYTYSRKRWVIETRKRTNRRGVLRHSEDVRAGKRLYRACWRKVCSKDVLVRMRG